MHTPALRPAWVEIDLGRLRQNFARIFAEKPRDLRLLCVVKDNAYGHGAVPVARFAVECGAHALGVVTVDEALALREAGIRAPILLLGERTGAELEICVQHQLTPCLHEPAAAAAFARLCAAAEVKRPFHVEVDTGMSRYGVRWTEGAETIRQLAAVPHLALEGVMSHFAMSDELDKSYALLQLHRFERVLAALQELRLRVPLRHMCNTGGYLDLPQAHFDMVRVGILPLGVYPSKTCRRIPGLEPVMRVLTRVAEIRQLQPGDRVGYGMRYTAREPRRIAVLPVGYGDGYPRVRNQGQVLIHGQRAPIIGGNAMDATMVDITAIPTAKKWDEVVLQGRQGPHEISANEIAQRKRTVCYDVLAGWRSRLPRVYKEGETVP